MDVAALRAQFPVLERLAYLNTGSVGGWTADHEIERLVAAATSTSSR